MTYCLNEPTGLPSSVVMLFIPYKVSLTTEIVGIFLNRIQLMRKEIVAVAYAHADNNNCQKLGDN